MKFQRMKKAVSALWQRFNLNWARAAEMQRRIDEARDKHSRIYLHWRF